eukprot:09074.XXX_733_900_1 [CDS] Oithona nana genome sequencing.
MAFAAARMIMPKEKVNRKPSAEFAAPSKNKVTLLTTSFTTCMRFEYLMPNVLGYF